MVEKIEDRILALENRVVELSSREESYVGENLPMIQVLLQQAIFLRILLEDLSKNVD